MTSLDLSLPRPKDQAISKKIVIALAYAQYEPQYDFWWYWAKLEV